jgi:hypothetical protein
MTSEVRRDETSESRAPKRLSLVMMLLAVEINASLMGCAARVYTPLTPVPAVSVYFADYGEHASLLLPQETGSLTEFAYGQWDWFAMKRQESWRAPLLLLVPSQSTLGMAAIPAAESTAELRDKLGANRVIRLDVCPKRSAALSNELRKMVLARVAGSVYSNDFGMICSPHPRPYWWAHHCNTVVADWLVELGCRVEGWPTFAAHFEFDQLRSTQSEESHPSTRPTGKADSE